MLLFHINWERANTARAAIAVPNDDAKYNGATITVNRDKGVAGITTACHGVAKTNVAKASLCKLKRHVADESVADKWVMATKAAVHNNTHEHMDADGFFRDFAARAAGAKGAVVNNNAAYNDIADNDVTMQVCWVMQKR